jgi:hypothetical protein
LSVSRKKGSFRFAQLKRQHPFLSTMLVLCIFSLAMATLTSASETPLVVDGAVAEPNNNNYYSNMYPGGPFPYQQQQQQQQALPKSSSAGAWPNDEPGWTFTADTSYYPTGVAGGFGGGADVGFAFRDVLATGVSIAAGVFMLAFTVSLITK